MFQWGCHSHDCMGHTCIRRELPDSTALPCSALCSSRCYAMLCCAACAVLTTLRRLIMGWALSGAVCTALPLRNGCCRTAIEQCLTLPPSPPQTAAAMHAPPTPAPAHPQTLPRRGPQLPPPPPGRRSPRACAPRCAGSRSLPRSAPAAARGPGSRPLPAAPGGPPSRPAGCGTGSAGRQGGQAGGSSSGQYPCS